MGRFFGSVVQEAQRKARTRVRAAACELRDEEGNVLLSGDYLKCAGEVVKRSKELAKGAPCYKPYGRAQAVYTGTAPNTFRWTIVGPDGAIRSRHAITVLS